MRWISGLLLLGLLAVTGLYVAGGRVAPPQLTITEPDRIVGQVGCVDLTAGAPGARFTTLTRSA